MKVLREFTKGTKHQKERKESGNCKLPDNDVRCSKERVGNGKGWELGRG